MKVLVYDKKSSTQFSVKEREQPIPQANEVLVRISFTSLNAADYRLVKMRMLPKSKVLGSAIVGTVDSVGSAVKNFQIGDCVMADLSDNGFGGLAEYVTVASKLLVKKPIELKSSIAVTLPLASTTALQGIKKSGLSAGDHVLVIGSSGGVGTFAVQLAKHLEAHVTGVCSTRNIEQTLSLGAEKVIDYTKENLMNYKGKFDRIIMVNGNYSLMGCKRLLKPNGHYVSVGGTLGQIFKTLFFGKLLFLGSKTCSVLFAKANKEDLTQTAELTKNGDLTPMIEKIYIYTEASEAMNYLIKGHAQGKIVIQMDSI